MNKIKYASLLIFISVQVHANEPNATDKIIKQCSGFTDVAKVAIEARQNRIPAAHMYKTLINQDNGMQDMLKLALDSAYKTPLAKNKEEKETIILEYTNQVFYDCMKILTSNNEN